MDKQTQAIGNDMGQLADDAFALMAATTDVAGEKVGEARQRLAAALDGGENISGRVKEKAVEGVHGEFPSGVAAAVLALEDKAAQPSW